MAQKDSKSNETWVAKHFIIKTFISGPAETNCYLLACDATRQAAVIDAPLGVTASLLREIKQDRLTVQMILITHSHWDHIADAASLKEHLKVPLYIHSLDQQNLASPGSDGLPLFFPIDGSESDGFFKEGDKFQVGNLDIEVIETPGHSPGGVCFWLRKEKVLFSGDTLFQGTIGNLSFPTAQPSFMWESLKKLATLPSETKVYPGHGRPTTIGSEVWLDQAQSLFEGDK